MLLNYSAPALKLIVAVFQVALDVLSQSFYVSSILYLAELKDHGPLNKLLILLLASLAHLDIKIYVTLARLVTY